MGLSSAGASRPYVLVNVAMTVDGKIDTAERCGAAISSARDNERVDRLRADADAVMVGGLTLLENDPRLTVKSAALRAERVAVGLSENPAKVAVVSRPELRQDARFLTSGPARIILFTTVRATAAEIAVLNKRGVEVYVLGDTQVDLPAAMEMLKTLGINRLMVEGGGTLNFELLRLGLVDELNVYIAPLVFGGAVAPTPAGGIGLPHAQRIRLQHHDVEVWDDGGVLLKYMVQ